MANTPTATATMMRRPATGIWRNLVTRGVLLVGGAGGRAGVGGGGGGGGGVVGHGLGPVPELDQPAAGADDLGHSGGQAGRLLGGHRRPGRGGRRSLGMEDGGGGGQQPDQQHDDRVFGQGAGQGPGAGLAADGQGGQGDGGQGQGGQAAAGQARGRVVAVTDDRHQDQEAGGHGGRPPPAQDRAGLEAAGRLDQRFPAGQHGRHGHGGSVGHQRSPRSEGEGVGHSGAPWVGVGGASVQGGSGVAPPTELEFRPAGAGG